MTVTGNSAAGASILDPAGLRRYREDFEEDGFTVARGLFGADEIERLCGEFGARHWRFWWAHCQARPSWTAWLRTCRAPIHCTSGPG
jgi:hypothetical protein